MTNQQSDPPQTPKSLASEYSYVDVTVPTRSNHASAGVEATLSNDTDTRHGHRAPYPADPGAGLAFVQRLTFHSPYAAIRLHPPVHEAKEVSPP